MGAIDDSHTEGIAINNDNDDCQDQIVATNLSALSAPGSASASNLSSPAEISPDSISNDTDTLALPIEQDLPRPFDNVSNDLAGLGALSIDDFLSNVTTSSAVFDVSFYVQLPETSIVQEKGDIERDEGDRGDDDGQTRAEEQRALRNMVAMLHEASNKVFGSSDCMRFEYMEEDPKNKQCIFTVTRPNGSTRSYKSDPNAGFTRRQDARMQAAKIAVEMGAIDFIVSGDADALKAKKGLLLNPFDVEIDTELNEIAPGMSKYTDEEEPLKLIEDACTEWRASRVKPHWVTYNDAKNKKKHGAALRISLNAHVFRAYSVDPIFNYQRLAKLACARSAVREGVLDFIKFGNGQTQPTKAAENDLEDPVEILRESTPCPPPKGLSLQEFFETLPRPFPESIGGASVNEFNAPAWLNLTLQSARGGRLVSSYTPVVDGVRHLHGCILRVERPGETRTYLVDPQFPKRSDARSAVCLLAMSQGVGSYIRGLKEEAENKLSPEKRRLANEKLLQVLSYECSKVKPGNRLIFAFATERDAFGCSLKVDISSRQPDIREFTVDTEYRNKTDAKAAVACHAAERGLVDLLRFRGSPLPSDYTPFWEAQVLGNGDIYIAKRKDRDREFDGEAQDRKRRKGNFRDKESTSDSGDFGSNMRFKVKGETLSDGAFLFRKQPPTGPSAHLKNGWKKPRVTGSSNGLSPTNGYAYVSRTVGQDRSVYRYSGTSSNPHSPDRSAVHPPTAPRAYSEMNLTSAGYPKRSHVTQRLNSSNFQSQHSGTSPNGMAYSRPRTNEYSQSNPYTQVEPPTQSATAVQGYSDSYGQIATYSQPPSYPTDPYARPDAYVAPYTAYPPSAVGLYPSPYPPPPPAQSYALYYGPHPAPAPASAPYTQYAPPPQYLASYQNGHYAAYSSHIPQHQAHYAHPQQAVVSPVYPTLVPPSDPSIPSGHYSPYHPPYSPLYSPHHVYSMSPPPHSAVGGDYSSQGRSHTFNDQQQDGYQRHQEGNSEGDRSSIGPLDHARQSPQVEVKQESIGDSQLLKVVEHPTEVPSPGSNLAALYDFCKEGDFSRPKFMFAIVKDEQGEKKFKVWAEQYSQRLELPTLFSNYEDGRDKLAKRVLHWMRKRT